jgi:hypothetical protein
MKFDTVLTVFTLARADMTSAGHFSFSFFGFHRWPGARVDGCTGSFHVIDCCCKYCAPSSKVLNGGLVGLLLQEEKEVEPIVRDVSPLGNGVSPREEFAPVEHPLEPPDSDKPAKCPAPEPCIVHVSILSASFCNFAECLVNAALVVEKGHASSPNPSVCRFSAATGFLVENVSF